MGGRRGMALPLLVLLGAQLSTAHGRAEPPPGSAHARRDFEHVPVVAQEVQHPVPLYVAYTGAAPLARVTVRYRAAGMADWASLDLRPMGAGWGVLVPCDELAQGQLLYYFTGVDAGGDAVATGGDRTDPYRTTIRRDRIANPPHLPGEPPPSACIGASDCPPDFPGCKQTQASRGKEGGELCDEDAECASGSCLHDVCRDVGEPKHTGRRLWFGLAGTFGIDVVPGQNDACKLQSIGGEPTSPDWYCVDRGGADYPSRSSTSLVNGTILPTGTSRSDQVKSGAAFGNVRLLASFDYALTGNWLVGGRFGVVLRNYPGDAGDAHRFGPPIHLEARTTYVFGDHPLFNAGVAPFVSAQLGLGHFETKASVQVIESTTSKNVDAWHLAGPGFVGVGGGFRIGVTPRAALSLGARVDFAFGDAFVPSVGPELGGVVGF